MQLDDYRPLDDLQDLMLGWLMRDEVALKPAQTFIKKIGSDWIDHISTEEYLRNWIDGNSGNLYSLWVRFLGNDIFGGRYAMLNHVTAHKAIFVKGNP